MIYLIDSSTVISDDYRSTGQKVQMHGPFDEPEQAYVFMRESGELMFSTLHAPLRSQPVLVEADSEEEAAEIVSQFGREGLMRLSMLTIRLPAKVDDELAKQHYELMRECIDSKPLSQEQLKLCALRSGDVPFKQFALERRGINSIGISAVNASAGYAISWTNSDLFTLTGSALASYKLEGDASVAFEWLNRKGFPVRTGDGLRSSDRYFIAGHSQDIGRTVVLQVGHTIAIIGARMKDGAEAAGLTIRLAQLVSVRLRDMGA